METGAAHELLDAMILNEQAGELGKVGEEFRGLDAPSARSLVTYADSLCGEARTKMFCLLRKHPDKHPVVMSLLRRTLELLDEDRRRPSLTAAQKDDLDWAERYARHIARFILRQTAARRSALSEKDRHSMNKQPQVNR